MNPINKKDDQGIYHIFSGPEELHRVLFEESVDAMFIADERGRYIAVNQRATELTGYSREELLSLNIADLIPAEDLAKEPLHMGELTQGRIVTNERNIRHKDGTLHPVEISARMLPGGKLLGSVRDITERKRAEEAFRKSEARFRQVVESSPIAIGFDSQGGKMEYFNPKLQETIGYTVEDIPTFKDWFDIIYPDPDYRERVRSEWIHSMETATKEGVSGKSMEVEITCRDGSVRIMEVFGATMGDLNLAMFTDLTDRKRSEKALKQSEERFRTLLQNIPALAIQGYRIDGTTTYWNHASEKLYGYTAEEAIGRNLLELIIPPEMQEAVRQSMQIMNENGQPIPSAELSLMRKDGSRVTVFSNHALVKLAGAAPELFCLDIDLRKYKQAEAEKEKLQAQLLQAQKMESVGRLAGGVAHDFNNMLTGILGHAQLAAMRYPSSDQIQADLRAIIEAAVRSADLVRQEFQR